MRYTSRNGGVKLRKPAADTVASFISSVEELTAKEGLFAYIDVKSEYMSSWARATAPCQPNAPSSSDPPQSRSIALTDISSRLPVFTRGHNTTTKIVAKNIALVTSTKFPEGAYSIITDPTGNLDPITFGNPGSIGALESFTAETDRTTGDWKLVIDGDVGVKLERIVLVIRYIIVESAA